MKVTVVGYWHAYPEKESATSGYLIEEENYCILIDCGSGVISQVQRYVALEEIDAIVISHYHQDHIGDVGAFHYFRLLQKYTNSSAMKPFSIYGHREDEEGFQRLSYKDIVTATPYTAEEPVVIGPFTFTFYPTIHPVPCYAMKIETKRGTIFYTADTSFSPSLAKAATGVDVMIAECSMYKGQDATPAGHMNSSDAGRLAHMAKVPKLLLTHLPHFGNHRDLIDEAKEQCPETEVELASSGWTFTL